MKYQSNYVAVLYSSISCTKKTHNIQIKTSQKYLHLNLLRLNTKLQLPKPMEKKLSSPTDILTRLYSSNVRESGITATNSEQVSGRWFSGHVWLCPTLIRSEYGIEGIKWQEGAWCALPYKFSGTPVFEKLSGDIYIALRRAGALRGSRSGNVWQHIHRYEIVVEVLPDPRAA